MPQAKVLTPAELKRVTHFASVGRHGNRNRALVLTSFFTGMRVGELASLRIGDVFGPRFQPLKEVILTPAQTKGDCGRVVYLNEKARRELSRYAATLGAFEPQAPLFYSQRSRQGFTANTLCQTVNAIYRDAGIKGATSHSGRRTYITSLADKGVAVHLLMALAGHRHLATTQRYIEVNPSQLSRAVELI